MQEENRNKQVIRDFTRIFKNEHNVDGVDHLFDTKNFVHHFRNPVSAGFEGLKQIGRMMNGAFPDVVVKEEDLVASADRVVERSSATATHKGSMMGEKCDRGNSVRETLRGISEPRVQASRSTYEYLLMPVSCRNGVMERADFTGFEKRVSPN